MNKAMDIQRNKLIEKQKDRQILDRQMTEIEHK